MKNRGILPRRATVTPIVNGSHLASICPDVYITEYPCAPASRQLTAMIVMSKASCQHFRGSGEGRDSAVIHRITSTTKDSLKMLCSTESARLVNSTARLVVATSTYHTNSNSINLVSTHIKYANLFPLPGPPLMQFDQSQQDSRSNIQACYTKEKAS